MSWYSFRPYVSVAQRRAKAQKELNALKARGTAIEPLGELSHRMKIATSFWGAAWCRHLESFSDYENRLPRGRTYVRNGSVLHLGIEPGVITALVQGSELYEQTICIDCFPAKKWKSVQSRCQGKIGSLIELLQGKISDEIMTVVTDRGEGLFPKPREIHLDCSCPDWAGMCKHLAAVLYGIGARLDTQPELLFRLRGVDHNDLIVAGATATGLDDSAKAANGRRRKLSSAALEDVFGIELDGDSIPPVRKNGGGKRARSKNLRRRKSAKSSLLRKPSPARKQPAFKPTAAAVRSLRKQLDISRAAFGEKLGVSAQSVANWEKSRGKLNLRTANLESLKGLHRDTQLAPR